MVEYIIPSSLEDALQVVGDASHSAEYRVVMGKALVRKALNHLCSLEHGNDEETREE